MDTIGILEQQAIDAAIANDWDKAVELNKSIIDQDDHNIGAHLRLGFALLQSHHIPEAAKAYKAALKIQPKNHLALENLERIEILQKQSGNGNKNEKKNLDPTLFLDVPGKTKTVQLVNLGQKHHLAELYIGKEVELKVKKRRIEVRTSDGDYIGTLPDDISKRIMFFLEENSVYRTFIKEASLSRILIFIKEVSKGGKVKDYVSFPQSIAPMYHPHAAEDSEGTTRSDDAEEKSGEDETEDDSWGDDEEEAPDSDVDEEEKEDLLHIHTEEDEDDSEE